MSDTKEKMDFRFRKGDLLAVVLVAVLAILSGIVFWAGQTSDGAYVEIYQDGVLIDTLPLDVDAQRVLTNRYTNIVTIRDGKVAVTASDCPGGDCLDSGWIDNGGRSIVCLPNGIELRIVSERSDVDFVVG